MSDTSENDVRKVWNELGLNGNGKYTIAVFKTKRTWQGYTAGSQPWLHAGTTWGVFIILIFYFFLLTPGLLTSAELNPNTRGSEWSP